MPSLDAAKLGQVLKASNLLSRAVLNAQVCVLSPNPGDSTHSLAIYKSTLIAVGSTHRELAMGCVYVGWDMGEALGKPMGQLWGSAGEANTKS